MFIFDGLPVDLGVVVGGFQVFLDVSVEIYNAVVLVFCVEEDKIVIFGDCFLTCLYFPVAFSTFVA